MKTIITAFLTGLIALLSLPVLSANEHEAHGGHTANQSKAPADAPMSEGTVKKIDKAAGKVTIAHGPLDNLKMPAMTMVFRVQDAAWLDQMQVGSKIRFVADTVNDALIIVRFESAK